MTNLQQVTILNDVLARLGYARACEASTPHVGPIESPFGVVGVDFTNGKYRARIRVCDALTGADTRITLCRSHNLEDCDYAYRAAHVALWGSASWAACDDLLDKLAAARA